MTILAIRKKLHHYIDTAQEKKVKAIFSLVEDELDSSNDIWTEEFLKEMNSRVEAYEKGKVKGRAWSAIKKAARQ